MQANVFFFPWEVTLMQWIQQHMSPAGVKLASLCSALGEEIVMISILGFLYWAYDKKFGKYVGTIILMALVWGTQLKSVFLRSRPYLNHEGIQCLKPFSKEGAITDLSAQGYSFPSGHSTNAVAAYGSLALHEKKHWLSIVSVIIMLLIGCSRVAVGMHYPTDVLGGWLVGAVAVFVGTYLQKKIKNKYVFYLIMILTGIPGMFFCKSEEYFMIFGVMIGGLLGFLLEEKLVNFEEASRWYTGIFRVIGGIVVFLVLQMLLKLPFSTEFMSSGTYAAYLVRMARYLIIAFVDIGVYPILFKKFAFLR